MNRTHQRAWIVLLLLWAGLWAACASGTPETVHYRLDLEPSAVEVPEPRQPVLGIEPFTVDAAYDDSQIVYRTNPYRLNYYYYHRWASAPGLMLTDSLRRGYQRTGYFQAVTSGEIARSDAVITGHVAALEEVDVSEEEWFGRVVLELRLRDTRTGTLLWSQVIEEEEPLAERSPAGLAEALSSALTRVVEETAPTIAEQAIASRP